MKKSIVIQMHERYTTLKRWCYERNIPYRTALFALKNYKWSPATLRVLRMLRDDGYSVPERRTRHPRKDKK